MIFCGLLVVRGPYAVNGLLLVYKPCYLICLCSIHGRMYYLWFIHGLMYCYLFVLHTWSYVLLFVCGPYDLYELLFVCGPYMVN